MAKLLTLSILSLAIAGGAYADEAQLPQLPHCDVPIASVMVGKLSCKAASCNVRSTGGPLALVAAIQAMQDGGGPQPNLNGIQDGIKDVLVTALTATGCFNVQDREQMDEIAQELQRAGRTVKVEQADFIISGAVTQVEFATNRKSVSTGFLSFIPGVAMVGNLVGSVGYKTTKASVALDMKLVDVNTAKVASSKSFEASSENSSFLLGTGLGDFGGGFGGFSGSFGGLKGSSLEAVTKDALWQSVTFLVESARQAKGVAARTTKTGNPLALMQ